MEVKKFSWEAPKGSSDSLNPVAPLEHVNCFTREALLQFARETGFTLVDIERETGADALFRKAKAILPQA